MTVQGSARLSSGFGEVCALTKLIRKTKTSKSDFQGLKLYLQPVGTVVTRLGQKVKIPGLASSLLCRSVCRSVVMPGPTGQPPWLGMDGGVRVSLMVGKGPATSVQEQLLCLQKA